MDHVTRRGRESRMAAWLTRMSRWSSDVVAARIAEALVRPVDFAMLEAAVAPWAHLADTELQVLVDTIDAPPSQQQFMFVVGPTPEGGAEKILTDGKLAHVVLGVRAVMRERQGATE